MSKTLDRIKKLLRLAGNGAASENEAESARRIAEAMMDAAGITLDDVTKAGGVDGADPASTVARQHGSRVRDAWRGTVAVAVARIVGCYCYRERSYDKRVNHRIVWIGTLEQRETAIALHHWVERQIRRLAASMKMRLRERRDWKSYLRAYRLGVADAIAEGALRMSEARAARVTDSTALAVRDRVAAAIDRLKPETKTSRSRPVRSDAFQVGRFDGGTVKLRHEVGGSNVKRLTSGGGQ